MTYINRSGKIPGGLFTVLTVAFIFISLLIQAQELDHRSPGAVRSRFVADLAVLASDSLEGRKSGTDGEEKAYNFIVNRFRELGLEPKGSDTGSYLQPFTYSEFLGFDLKSSLLINGNEYHQQDDFGVTRFSGSGSFEGKYVDGGNGFVIPRKGRDDYSGKGDLTGKAVLIDLSVPRGTAKGDSLGGWINPKKRIDEAVLRGAAAVILWNPDHPNFRIFNFDQCDTASVPVIYVNSETADYIKSLPQSVIKLNVSVKFRKSVFYNVIGFLDHHAEKTVIIGAHYDHMGKSPKYGIRYGADDNASGTAMVLELAKYLQEKQDPGNNYLFIAFSGEEEGLLGSSWYCKHPTIDLAKVSFMINLDMVGRLGCEGKMIYAIGTASSPEWKYVYKNLHSDDFRVKKMRGAGFFSDNTAFYKQGIPGAYFTTGFHYDYHTRDDSKEKINYDGMVAIARYIENFIDEAEKSGTISYSKATGWDEFNANLHYILEELDYLMVVGTGGAE